ncbi:MAG: riboflavin synthase [Rhodothalassiaceae bacterium]
MFTGLVTDVGRVRRILRDGDLRLWIGTGYDLDSIPLGASIACSGVCLTVVDKDEESFAVDVSAETLACTTLGEWREGERVNLERSLRLGDELGGHIVTGHVDAVGEILAIEPVEGSKRFRFSLPPAIAPYVAQKGSIAVDGVSLTVNTVSARDFTANLIPHTLAHTAFGSAGTGEHVNLEIDILARYIARMNEAAKG